MSGLIFDIQGFSVHDGPGVRTTVFLKGCPLACRWCHNPEGIGYESELMYFGERCILCGACVGVCKNDVHRIEDGVHAVDFEKCAMCLACIKACPSEAVTKNGAEYTPEALVKRVMRDLPFWGDNGGVTFSGGEAMTQVDFLRECLILLKERNIHTAVDTSGCASWQSFEKILPFTNLFLYDIKHVDDDKHKKFCGASNRLILENIMKLSEKNVDVLIRIPLIGGFNDDDESVEGICAFLKGLNKKYAVDVMPYHVLGKNKYELVGRKSCADDTYYVSKARADECRKRIELN